MNTKIMTHIVAGYPTLEESEKIALAMDKCGADYIEIQIPFSDPVADGEVIMRANQKALESGIKVRDSFALMKKLSKKTRAKLLFMTYFNILHAYGVDDFCRRTAECGAYGLIVPDMPIDEEKHDGYLRACKKYGLKAIQVISPLTPERRLKLIAKHADGFVYCVSRYGTTGTSEKLNPELSSYLKKVRRYIKLPLAVGFGISSRAQVKAVHSHAEIAVVGSAFIRIYEKEGLQGIRKFMGTEATSLLVPSFAE